ncbi:hypothetical protein [Caenispirillum salinarum]|nr:hypothetical protein [Caenispirillum salinarum]
MSPDDIQMGLDDDENVHFRNGRAQFMIARNNARAHTIELSAKYNGQCDQIIIRTVKARPNTGDKLSIGLNVLSWIQMYATNFGGSADQTQLRLADAAHVVNCHIASSPVSTLVSKAVIVSALPSGLGTDVVGDAGQVLPRVELQTRAPKWELTPAERALVAGMEREACRIVRRISPEALDIEAGTLGPARLEVPVRQDISPLERATFRAQFLDWLRRPCNRGLKLPSVQAGQSTRRARGTALAPEIAALSLLHRSPGMRGGRGAGRR